MSLPMRFVSSLDDTLVAAAHNQAVTALRHGRKGDHAAKNAAINRMFNTLNRCHFPNLAASRVAAELGRGRALSVRLNKGLVDMALKMIDTSHD